MTTPDNDTLLLALARWRQYLAPVIQAGSDCVPLIVDLDMFVATLDAAGEHLLNQDLRDQRDRARALAMELEELAATASANAARATREAASWQRQCERLRARLDEVGGLLGARHASYRPDDDE